MTGQVMRQGDDSLIDPKVYDTSHNLLLKPMGFACRGVWVMGYCGPMGYGVKIPAHRVGGPEKLWVIRGYGLTEVWFMRGSTVHLR